VTLCRYGGASAALSTHEDRTPQARSQDTGAAENDAPSTGTVYVRRSFLEAIDRLKDQVGTEALATLHGIGLPGALIRMDWVRDRQSNYRLYANSGAALQTLRAQFDASLGFGLITSS
jgi:hypothetical protein